MNFLIDDVARILATPVSRRRAFQLVCGAVLGATSVGTLFAQANGTSCTNNAGCTSGNCSNCGGGAQGKVCVPAGQACCSSGPPLFTCTQGQCCCPSTLTCSSSQGPDCSQVSGCRNCGGGGC
jgi:hypothetical protein